MKEEASKTATRSAASYLIQRRLCLDHAGDLIAAAERVIGNDSAYSNIAYHLAILAMEEIGKAGLLGCRAVIGESLDAQKLESRLGDHVYKLLWALWSPSILGGKLDPKDFEEARVFAERMHARRLAGLYVDGQQDISFAPREAVKATDATTMLNLVKTRLLLESEREGPGPDTHNEELEWYLATLANEIGAKRLFSPSFIQKHEEFAGNTRGWIRWAREEFAKIMAEEREHLRRELSRPPGGVNGARPKWLMKIRLQTSSHSIRQKVLNVWNERIDAVKLRHIKKSELFLEMTIHDGVTLDRLFDTGLALSKLYVAMLNIGSAGFFWYELSGQAQTYYESIIDLDAPHLLPRIGRTSGLPSEWLAAGPNGGESRRAGLEDIHVMNAMICLGVFGSMTDANASPIFGPYLSGLALLAKTDLHLTSENQARDAFANALRAAMRHFGDWGGDEAALLEELHRVFTRIMPEEEHRALLFRSVSIQSSSSGTLSDAVTVKRVTDLYLIMVAQRLWPDFIKRAQREVS
jgi:AbiV family abortive infection protein